MDSVRTSGLGMGGRGLTYARNLLVGMRSRVEPAAVRYERRLRLRLEQSTFKKQFVRAPASPDNLARSFGP